MNQDTQPPQDNQIPDERDEQGMQEQRQGRREEQVLLSWEAPSRPYRKRDKEFYTTVGIIVFLVSLILFFAGQFLFIAVVVSLAFVSYVLASVPPDRVHNLITTFGVRAGDNLFYWEELSRFWFTQDRGVTLLHIETSRAFPGVLLLLIEGVKEEEVKKIMLKYTVFEKPKDTWLDTAGKWLQEKFPLERE